MQMPGGQQENPLIGHASIGPRESAQRRSRKDTRTSSSHREQRSVSEHRSVHQQVSAVDAEASSSGRLATTDEIHASLSSASTNRSRSRFEKFVDSVSKPFLRPRSRSAAPTSRSPQPQQLPSSQTPSSTAAVHSSFDALQLSSKSVTASERQSVEPLLDVFQFADGRIPGVVGLANHGNTCFMNAVLQCLSNTELFVEYFTTDQCHSDMLTAQRAGRSCLITDQLAQLLTSLWTCEYTPEKSLEFKARVGQCASQYSGTEQNDAQEFLQWLLDDVNEELYGSSVELVNNAGCHKTKVCCTAMPLL
jgi:hypothetical protein